MSITPKQWSEKDAQGEAPDANLRLETFFNFHDSCLYRVIDFILVQEPDGEREEPSNVTTVGEVVSTYTVNVPGEKRWYVLLEKVDGDERVAFRYNEFDDATNPDFHRVKNSSKPKGQIRGSQDRPDYTPPKGFETFDHTGDRAMQDAEVEGQRALSSRSRASSVDMRTGPQRTLRTDRSRD